MSYTVMIEMPAPLSRPSHYIFVIWKLYIFNRFPTAHNIESTIHSFVQNPCDCLFMLVGVRVYLYFCDGVDDFF